MDIGETDHLIAYFKDVAPPEPEAGPSSHMPPVSPRSEVREPGEPKAGDGAGGTGQTRQAADETEGAHHPDLEDRSAAPKLPSGPAVPPAPNEQVSGVSYQLKKAHCDGMVSVHQDPEDRTKPRGTDILGSQMVIDSTPDGSIPTVFGWDNRPGEVQRGDVADWSEDRRRSTTQSRHNRGSRFGRDPLIERTDGAEPKTVEPVVIHFRDGMTFKGALKIAEFFGR